jgi:predicted nucleotidyltransferase
MMPPKEYLLSPFKNIHQYITHDPDRQIFALEKFIKLASENNPNIMELLFIDEKWIKKVTPEFMLLRKNRDLFLSAKCKFTYSGYGISQLKRIQRHKRWLDNPSVKPDRKEFGLPKENKLFDNNVLDSMMDNFRNKSIGILVDSIIDKYTDLDKNDVQEIMQDTLNSIPRDYFRKFSLNYFSRQSNDIVREDIRKSFVKEIEYFVAKREWSRYCSWRENRNPVRAKIEEEFGFDLKHGTHLARLLLQAEEILLKGKLTVFVGNRQEIWDIKNGKWTYEQLIEWAEKLDKKLENIYQNKDYVVPHKPNIKKIEELYFEIINSGWYDGKVL